jgi:hypothetical protein
MTKLAISRKERLYTRKIDVRKPVKRKKGAVVGGKKESLSAVKYQRMKKKQ